jgi:hypothetical protein
MHGEILILYQKIYKKMHIYYNENKNVDDHDVENIHDDKDSTPFRLRVSTHSDLVENEKNEIENNIKNEKLNIELVVIENKNKPYYYDNINARNQHAFYSKQTDNGNDNNDNNSDNDSSHNNDNHGDHDRRDNNDNNEHIDHNYYGNHDNDIVNSNRSKKSTKSMVKSFRSDSQVHCSEHAHEHEEEHEEELKDGDSDNNNDFNNNVSNRNSIKNKNKNNDNFHNLFTSNPMITENDDLNLNSKENKRSKKMTFYEIYCSLWLTIVGILSAVLGIVFFATQTRENYWILHSCWHTFVMFSSYLLIRGRNTFIVTVRRCIEGDGCIKPIKSCIKKCVK